LVLEVWGRVSGGMNPCKCNAVDAGEGCFRAAVISLFLLPGDC